MSASLALLGQPELPAPIANTIDLARTAPPELFADAVLKLAESGKIPEGEARTRLLQEVFMAAGRAQEPVRLRPVPGLPKDSRAVFRAKASELGLDSLSLEARTIRLLSKSEPGVARQLFESAAHPAIERLPCEDPLIPDASAYMEMAGLIAREGMPVETLRDALDGAKSPIEIAAFANAIEPLSLAPEEWQALLSALAAKMEATAPDYRSFTLSIASLREPLEKLASRVSSGNAPELRTAFRRYLTTQMSAARCDEDFGNAREIVEWFNSEFRGTLDPIAESEIEPSQRMNTFLSESYFASPDAKPIAGAFARLKVKPDAGDPAWRVLLADFLRDFTAWTPAGSEIDAFHQKLVVLRGLLELLPSGDERDQVIAQSISVLQTSRAERLFPAEWLMQVKSLVDAAGPDGSKFLDAFRGSGDPGLALFARDSGA